MDGKSMKNETVRETTAGNRLELGGSWKEVFIGYCLTYLEKQFEVLKMIWTGVARRGEPINFLVGIRSYKKKKKKHCVTFLSNFYLQ